MQFSVQQGCRTSTNSLHLQACLSHQQWLTLAMRQCIPARQHLWHQCILAWLRCSIRWTTAIINSLRLCPTNNRGSSATQLMLSTISCLLQSDALWMKTGGVRGTKGAAHQGLRMFMIKRGLMLGLTTAKVLSQPLQLVAAGGIVNTGRQQHLCQQHTHLLSGPCTRHLDVHPKQ